MYYFLIDISKHLLLMKETHVSSGQTQKVVRFPRGDSVKNICDIGPIVNKINTIDIFILFPRRL